MNEIDKMLIHPLRGITRKKISRILNEEKELLDSIEPSSLYELYKKHNIKVSRVFKIRNSAKELIIDMHSIEYGSFTKYDHKKSDHIVEMEDIIRTLPNNREYFEIYSNFQNDVCLETYVDRILETRKNGNLYSLKIIKNKKEYILDIESCLEEK